MQQNNWQQTWEKVHSRDTTNLIEKDGFEKVIKDENCLNDIVNNIYDKFNYKEGMKILEVGAGSGMILEKLIINHNVLKENLYACDYSKNAISNLTKILYSSNIRLTEARNLNLVFLNKKFDIIYCNSVFHYFPDYKYAEETLLTMKKILNINGKICIFDVTNLQKSKFEDYTKMSSRYSEDLSHLYYPYNFFVPYMSTQLNMSCAIFLNNIKDYAYYLKRMNVIYE